MKTSHPPTGILLLAFGSPDSLEDVEPFLQNIFPARMPDTSLVQQIKKHYERIGGKSPLNELTERQALRLQRALEKRGKPCEVHIGMRYWRPSITEAISALNEKRVKKILCVILSPFLTEAATGGYNAAVYQTIKASYPAIDARFVSPWNTHPHYLDAVADTVKKGLAAFSADIRSSVPIVFSAHSLPLNQADTDHYVGEITKTISGVMARFEQNEWHCAFQSRGKEGRWLSPSVEDVLKNLAASLKKDVLVVPLGFVSDHLETLYDLDIVLKEKAFDLGLSFQRAPSLNDSPHFIEALTEIIIASLNRLDP